MSYWRRRSAHVQDPTILAFADGVETPHSITLPSTKVPTDLEGNITFPAGLFIAKVGGAFRLLPRVNTASTVTSASTTSITVSPYQVLAPGDVLRVVLPSATVTLSGTFANGEDITINFAGRAFNYVISGTPTPAQLGPLVAAAFNASDLVNDIGEAVAEGAVIYIYGRDGLTLHTLTVAENTASGTITASSAALVPGAVVGTVSTVVQTSNNTGTVTLQAASAVSLPNGAKVGVLTDEIYGVYPRSGDFTDRPSIDIAPIAGAHGIYETALPYVDGDIRRRLPKLRIAAKF